MLSVEFILIHAIIMQYVKHCAVKMAKPGRNVVVINHRGLGGVSLTVCILTLTALYWYFICACYGD